MRGEESRMSPRILDWATGRIQWPFTEMQKLLNFVTSEYAIPTWRKNNQ